MIVNPIKSLFIVRVTRKNDNPCPDDHSLLIYSTSFWYYQRCPPWNLLDIITSNLHLIGWPWWRPRVHCHGMMTYMRTPSRFLYHTHYVNSDLRCHFIIYGYGIFLYLHFTISYPRTMYAYKLLISVSSSFVPTLDTVLSPPVSMMDSIILPYVFTLDYIYYLFDITLTTFPTSRIMIYVVNIDIDMSGDD